MVYISTLRLTNFRSYGNLDLSLSQQPVVLYGANGAGKTNLMEAVSFLSPGRGLRRARMEDLARRENETVASAWGVNALIKNTSENDEVRISVGQVPEHPLSLIHI